jgi:hypothetical protein
MMETEGDAKMDWSSLPTDKRRGIRWPIQLLILKGKEDDK